MMKGCEWKEWKEGNTSVSKRVLELAVDGEDLDAMVVRVSDCNVVVRTETEPMRRVELPLPAAQTAELTSSRRNKVQGTSKSREICIHAIHLGSLACQISRY